MHLLMARGKFSKEELQKRKESSDELVRDIERFRGIEQDTGGEREAQRGRGEAREDRQREPREREPER